MTPQDLIGSWWLVKWQSLKNSQPDGYPMGEDAQGQIIYSADGRMSGFLMRNDFGDQPRDTAASPDICLAYGGTYRIEGDQVIHDVMVSTVPYWINGPLIRTIVPEGDDILLKTKPETTSSGNTYEHHLLWRRVADGA
ncbi:MAG: lipocalin-like domain-containing protein [Proteobacteria bacterium]|nr:lipocalin-like domain-containing protein [Pseudomonadota bacterium]